MTGINASGGVGRSSPAPVPPFRRALSAVRPAPSPAVVYQGWSRVSPLRASTVKKKRPGGRSSSGRGGIEFHGPTRVTAITGHWGSMWG